MNSVIKKPIFKILLFLVVVLVSGFLRFYGLRWGLPNLIHAYSYHPDEFLIVGSSSQVYSNHNMDPGFYNYPSLYIYCSALSMAVAIGYGASVNLGNIYLFARIVSAFFGSAAIVGVFWAGRKLHSYTVAIVAAAILAIIPLHVQHSHFATVDVPSTLFVALTIGFAALIIKRGTWKDYILAAVMAGLAAGTKYNAGLVLFAPIAAHFFADDKKSPNRLVKLVLLPLICILVFIISTPGCLINTQGFIHGITYEMKHVSEGHGLVFTGTGNGLLFTIFNSIWYGAGPAFTLIFLSGVVIGIIKKNKMILMMLAFIVPYVALISMSQVRFARYIIPALPALSIICAWVIIEIWEMFRSKSTLKFVYIAVITILYVLTCSYSVSLNSIFGKPDVRDRAYKWITANIPAGSSIGVQEVPWFYSPPYSKNIGFGTLPNRIKAANKSPYNLVVFADYSASEWNEPDKPEWVIFSNYEINDAIRLKNIKNLPSDKQNQVDRINENIKYVESNYMKIRTYKNDLYAFGFGITDTLNLPHDMQYTTPQLYIYKAIK